MKYLVPVVAVIFVLALLGCVGPATSGTFTCSSFKDGKLVGVTQVDTPEANIPRDQYDVTLDKEGKLSWWVKASNPGKLRTKAMGELGCYTDSPVGFFCVKFEKTVEGSASEVIGQNGLAVAGVTKDTKIVRISPMLLIGAGCETPNTKVAGNWPPIALTVDPIVLDTGNNVTKVVLIPAPTFKVVMPEIDINETGGTRFTYQVIAKNNEAVPVSIKIRTVWIMDTGEVLPPSLLEFNLAGGEERTIDGAPVKTRKPFLSVTGKSALISKTYVK